MKLPLRAEGVRIVDAEGRIIVTMATERRFRATWEVHRDYIIAAVNGAKEKAAALKACEQLFAEALPKFNWGASALDANAVRLLNETPALVAKALKS